MKDNQNKNVGMASVISEQGGLLACLTCMHPAVKLYIWVCVVVTVQILSPQVIILLFPLFFLLVLKLSRVQFFQLIRKTRWILLSLLLIYAYASPGVLVWSNMGVMSPKIEGLYFGAIQLARLIIVLSGLAILLALITRFQLIVALYTWFKPLALIGVSRQRLAVRLALTLSYAESSVESTQVNWQGSIESMLTLVANESEYVELELIHLKLIDYLVATMMTVVVFGAWL